MANELNRMIVGGGNLSADLLPLVDRVNTEAAEYAHRADDVRQLEEWIAKGDHRMGIYQAKQVVERKANIRVRNSRNA